jgi:hypothetical protein
MWVRWARLTIVHKIDGLLKNLALLAPQKVWHLPKMWDDRQKVPLTTPHLLVGEGVKRILLLLQTLLVGEGM